VWFILFKRIGSLVLGYDSTDIKALKRLYDNGRNLGIENLEILNKDNKNAYIITSETKLNDTK